MIRELHDKLLRKEISSTEVVETFLARIRRENKALNAFITQTPELALQQAKEVDAKIHRGEELPLLAGIPCAIKDSILVKDVLCTAGSKILKNYIAPYDATVTRKLREQGALFVGKQIWMSLGWEDQRRILRLGLQKIRMMKRGLRVEVRAGRQQPSALTSPWWHWERIQVVLYGFQHPFAALWG